MNSAFVVESAEDLLLAVACAGDFFAAVGTRGYFVGGEETVPARGVLAIVCDCAEGALRTSGSGIRRLAGRHRDMFLVRPRVLCRMTMRRPRTLRPRRARLLPPAACRR